MTAPLPPLVVRLRTHAANHSESRALLLEAANELEVLTQRCAELTDHLYWRTGAS